LLDPEIPGNIHLFELGCFLMLFFQKQMETSCKIWSPKDVIAFNTVIVACGKGQRWRDALELMKQLEDHGLLPTVVTYSSVMT